MQLVSTNGPVSAANSDDQPAYALDPNETYVLYDSEVAAALRAGTVQWVATLDSRLRSYSGQPLTTERLVLPFIGRLGDALIAAGCLRALREKYPDVSIDIACLPAVSEVFQLTPTFGEVLAYPLRAEQLERYDYHLCFEDIAAIPNATGRGMFEVFSRCLNTPRPTEPAPLIIPESATSRCPLPPSQQRRVALHVGEAESLRTYPVELTIQLANELCEHDIEVVLFGSPTAQTKDLDSRVASPIRNRVGRTESIADLAAILQQMDAVITGDSFPLHLAGALNIKTVALFSPTDSAIASEYESITTIRSKAKCSPCGVAFGACPIGHAACIAHDDESLAPARIATLVMHQLQETPSPI